MLVSKTKSALIIIKQPRTAGIFKLTLCCALQVSISPHYMVSFIKYGHMQGVCTDVGKRQRSTELALANLPGYHSLNHLAGSYEIETR